MKVAHRDNCKFLDDCMLFVVLKIKSGTNAKNRRTSLGLSPVRIFQFVGVLKDFCATFCATLGVGKPPVSGVRRNQAKIENRLVNKG